MKEKTLFVGTSVEGVLINYVGVKPENGLAVNLVLSVDGKGTTKDFISNTNEARVLFKQSFAEGELFAYVPRTLVKKGSIELQQDANGVKFANFIIQSSINLDLSAVKSAKL